MLQKIPHKHIYSFIICLKLTIPIIAGLCALYLVGVIVRKSSLVVYILLSFCLCYTLVRFLPNRKLIHNLVLSVCTFLFALAIFDVVSRPLLNPLIYYSSYERYLDYWPQMPSLIRYHRNVYYQGKTFGNLSALTPNKNLRQIRKDNLYTDELGFRNKKGASRKLIEVIILGDSFAAGGGTAQEEIISSVLLEKYTLDTYNLSLEGLNPWEEFVNLTLTLDQLKTDNQTIIVWIFFGSNDLDEFQGGQLIFPYRATLFQQAKCAFHNFRGRSPLKILLVRAMNPQGYDGDVIIKKFLDGKYFLFSNEYIQKRTPKMEDILRHPRYPTLKTVFNCMKHLVNARQLKVLVVSVPAKEEIYSWVVDNQAPWSSAMKPSGFSLVLEKLAQEMGFQFLDLKSIFIAKSKELFENSGELLYWYDDTHWNWPGNALAGALVYDKIFQKSR